MLVSPKWQAMWLESQQCSKTTVNVTVPSQEAKNLLEDIKAGCSSPNKTVQLEALKRWGAWINNQNQENWRLNTVCYTAVRPLLTKKLQPFQKDVDICKLRFSLMWALLRKVQDIMQLEGPQYILQVFLQSCLNWLSSCTGDEGEEITELIFQLLLCVFSKEESANSSDKDMFPPLSVNLFKMNKVFGCFSDKLLNVFLHRKKVQNKAVALKLWKQFLVHCELSCEHIAVPVWHRLFKLVSQICSEKSEPVKERLSMIHGCSTILRSVLSSSKFFDYDNSLMTPCEALFRKLVDLCRSECEEFYDAEMFVQGMEMCKVLSAESFAIGGYGLSISVLDMLEEFSLKSLYWGVWCGLVHCYISLSSHTDQNHRAKVQTIFYRKLRGVAINFDLDKEYLGNDCIMEVKKCIRELRVCLCPCRSSSKEMGMRTCDTEKTVGVCGRSSESSRAVYPAHDHVSDQFVCKTDLGVVLGGFPAPKKAKPRVIRINFELANRTLKSIGIPCVKAFLNGTLPFRFISVRVCDPIVKSKLFSLPLKPPNKKRAVLRTPGRIVFENVNKKAITYPGEKSEAQEEETNVRKTRSRKRAEEEEKRQEIENQKRKTRKSFEIRVQEIVQKNKERKTEKNCKKSSVISLKEKRKSGKGEKRDTAEEKPKKEYKAGKSPKLEKYFKVIEKKSSDDKTKETPKKRGRKRKEEISWKQTSLKTMMIQEKETKNGGVRTRGKEKEVDEGNPLTKINPFRDVFHDHEYARRELNGSGTFERVVVNKEESEEKTAGTEQTIEVPGKGTSQKIKRLKTKKAKGREGSRKSKRLAVETVTTSEPESEKEETNVTLENTPNDESDVPEPLRNSNRLSSSEPKSETSKSELEESFETGERISPEAEKVAAVTVTGSNRLEGVESVVEPAELESINSLPNAENVSERATTETQLESISKEENPKAVNETAAKAVNDSREESKCATNSNETEMYGELDSTPRRSKKRFRILDSLKPSKKLKLEEPEEKLALEVEKENLEEVSPLKEEKSLNGSPKPVNGMISSRALRMIALLPESTRSQVHWETSPKVEVKKKGPNVDKNSRASKMLALLSENVREVVEAEEAKSNGDLPSSPLLRTPTSSLKSPKTVKQRRSIRFDDTKNETVVYETDTPPSQVLEGKEKWRRIQSSEVNSPIRSIP